MSTLRGHQKIAAANDPSRPCNGPGLLLDNTGLYRRPSGIAEILIETEIGCHQKANIPLLLLALTLLRQLRFAG